MSDSHARLQDLMRHEIDAVGRLRAVLDQEFQALRDRDIETMEGVVGDKQTLVGELERCGVQRESLLRMEGHAADRDGFNAFLARADGSLAGSLREQWEHLREQLKACQTQNLVNGQVLEASRRATQQTLAVLLGNPQGARQQTYDRSGGTHAQMSGRCYAKA